MYVKVQVFAEARKEKIGVIGEKRLEIMVKEPAKNNLANKRVIELVARHFSIPPNKVKLISGHRSGSKMVAVDL